MNDSRAIAAITATLGHVVAVALHGAPNLSAAPDVRFGRPVAEPNFVGAGLFLLRISPNGARRNDDLATRSHNGIVVQRPRAAVDLDYLISFHGEDARLEPQRMLGAVMAALHEQPLLTAKQVRATIAAARPEDPLFGARYAAHAPPAHVTLAPLEPEALHRIWGLFPQTPYQLSLAYTVSCVFVDIDVDVEPAPLARHIVPVITPRVETAEEALAAVAQSGAPER